MNQEQKKILLLTPYGPDNLEWGQDMYDVLGSRLARGNGVFGMTSHLHAFALYLIAENISNPCTVLEHPLWEDFVREVKKGYDIVGFQFKSIYAPKVVKMMKHIKKESPETEIVVGGYGVGMLNDPVPNDPENHAGYIKDNANYLCREEGVKFFRKILKDTPVDRPINQYHLPAGSFSIPNLYFKLRIPTLLVSLGCPNACDFCNTSAFFYHKKIYTAEPQQIYDFMKGYQKRYNDDDQVFILFDEDFFLNPEYVRELGRLIRSDKKTWGFRYFTFGSIGALSKFEPQELRENGLAAVWIGVESGLQQNQDVETGDLAKKEGQSKTGYAKRDGTKSAPEVFKGLHEYGIATVASMILGFDFHTKENIEKDIDYFVSLKPTFYQVGVLTPCPGTKLYKKIVESNRLHDHFSWKDMHLWKSDVFKVKNFAQNELRKHYDSAHQKLNTINGPPLVQIFDATVMSYKNLKDSKSEYLRRQAEKSKTLMKLLLYIMNSVKNRAPSPAVRQRIQDIENDALALLNDESFTDKIKRSIIQTLADFWMDGAKDIGPESGQTKQYVRWTYYNQPGKKQPYILRPSESKLKLATLDNIKKYSEMAKFIDEKLIESKIKKAVGVF